MKVTGSHTVAAPRDKVWDALHDPAVLVEALPGCQRLEVTGDDTYAVTVMAGVASIKGTYAGRVEVSDKQQPSAYRMRASGSGAPGTISADAAIRLEDVDGGRTRIDYDADAVVGGAIGGVGQRVLVGVSRRTAAEFFDAVERHLTGASPTAAQPSAEAEGATRQPAVPTAGQTFQRRAVAAAPTDVTKLLAAMVVGAAVALAGVIVGRRSTR